MKRQIAFLAMAALLAACTAAPAGTSPPATVASVGASERSTIPPRIPQGVGVALEPVDDCDVLLDYLIEQALEQVGPWGLGGGGFYARDGAVTEETMAADSAAGDDASGGAAEPSSTNVQVEGVDEGDIVKAAGDELYVLSSGRLIVYSTAGGGLEELASVEIARQFGSDQMLLDGDRLVVMGAGFDHRLDEPVDSVASDIAPVGSALTEITLVDVSDPSDPRIDRRVTMDGTTVATRLVDGHLRLVLEAQPVGLDWVRPEGSGLRAEREATERNREVIRRSTIENWLPYYVTDADEEGLVLGCDDVLLPPEPSGLGTLSILDFDLTEGIDSWEAASVVASGTTVYANVERTYVATQRWLDPAGLDSREDFDGHVTRIHRFDTPVDGNLAYVASGDVDGFLLNQFAMDEHRGHLRVASTSAPSWWGGGEESVSQVSVLAARDDRLVEVGSVGGLGETETIRAVRFMGPVGYVVTFRQVDPLYVIDLSDPTAPKAAGELKIPGYSAYLHPVGESMLLGVGQDADPETGAVYGLQLSLFDVSDPTDPVRVDTFGMGRSGRDRVESHVWSPVEGDHKAFTLADDTGYVPFEGWSWSERDETERSHIGLIAANWSDGTLEGSRVLTIFEGKATGDQWAFSPQRAVVKGDTIYAIGHGGISVIHGPSGEVVDQDRF
ncbi:MAG: beta-propeller domain-containing protein [Actinomycetota bacterium]